MIIKTLSFTVIYNTHLVTTQKNIYINISSITQLVSTLISNWCTQC